MAIFIRRLWAYARPYKTRLVMGLLFGCLYAMVSGLLMLLVRLVATLTFPGADQITLASELNKAPAFLQPLTHSLQHWLPALKSTGSKNGQVLLICVLPALMFLRGVCGYLNIYLTNWAAVRAIADLRVKLFSHLQNQPLSFFANAKTGDLIARVVNDTYALHSVIANSTGSLLKDPLTLISLLTVLLVQPSTRKLTLVSIVVMPICLVPVVIYGKKIRKSARAMQSHLAELSNLMHESFTGNRVIKAYNLEGAVLGKVRQATQKFVGHMMRVVRANELPSQMTEFVGVLGVCMVLLYVTFQTMKHQDISVGDFVMFIVSLLLMYQPVKTMARLYNQLHQAAASSQRVFDYLEMQSTLTEVANPMPLAAAGQDIHFEEIDFDYGEKSILRGINFTVKAGQLVALVGRTGSGKTTITNLLLRFYDPKKGQVKIGGTDIRQVRIKDLREQIALVDQETILFNDTVRQNIRLGRQTATDAEVESAARHAHAHEFIMEKPLGYETIVGEKGVSLSGGQRQRIAIARALLRNAPILVLDEATSSLDSESERAVQDAFEELMQGRTTICIAHRLSTIQKADVILALENGRIVEAGTHAELIQARGLYCKLYELQFEPAMA